jgi:NADH:ubiquinone oxidoreductase subunit 6 (subunit J)
LQREPPTLDITGILFVVLAIGVLGGGVAVVTLRNIMLTQAGDANLPAPFQRQGPIALAVAVVIAALVGWAALSTDWGLAAEAVSVNLEALAIALFDEYALPFEIISLLLLAAIIGAIFLARRPEEDERAN